MGSVWEERVLCNLASGRHWLRLLEAKDDSYFNIPAQTQLRKTGGITNPIFFLPNLRHVTYGLGMGRGGFVLPGIRKTLASTIRRSARSFSVFCLIKANDNKTCLRNTQASSGDRLLVRPSKSQFTSNKCMSLCAKQPLQLMQFTAEPYNGANTNKKYFLH